jgi:hypothetical protein
MMKSIPVIPKKKRGRPATGKDPLLTIRVPASVIKSVNSIATSERISKSEAVRQLLERGLAAWVEEQR